jgi:hypothetical protein
MPTDRERPHFPRTAPVYNPGRMTHRIRFSLAGPALLMVVLASAGPAHGQGFGSVSSAPGAEAGVEPQAAPLVEPTNAALPAPQPGPAGPATAAVPPAAATFASVSTPAPFGSASSAASDQATGAGPRLPAPGGFETADRILVEKGVRRLRLYRAGAVIAEYPIKLGLNPYGHKQREGDFRTPEGEYRLSRRNPRSEFFLSLEVSYPNDADLARARRARVPPGGLIMIHGQPNVPRKPQDYYARNDWTNGCIAVSNSDMVDIWLRTGVGTPIEIRP